MEEDKVNSDKSRNQTTTERIYMWPDYLCMLRKYSSCRWVHRIDQYPPNSEFLIFILAANNSLPPLGGSSASSPDANNLFQDCANRSKEKEKQLKEKEKELEDFKEKEKDIEKAMTLKDANKVMANDLEEHDQ